MQANLIKLRTQIGGKFSRLDLGLFDLKRRLVDAGIEVNYPAGDFIVKTVNGVDLSFDPDSESLSFFEVETEYLKSIRDSSFHTVHNAFRGNLGYVGKSAGMEIAYAMLHRVPVVLMYHPSFQASIDSRIRNLLSSKEHLFNIIRIDRLTNSQLLNQLERISASRVDYVLSVETELNIMANVETILGEYRLL